MRHGLISQMSRILEKLNAITANAKRCLGKPYIAHTISENVEELKKLQLKADNVLADNTLEPTYRERQLEAFKDLRRA